MYSVFPVELNVQCLFFILIPSTLAQVVRVKQSLDPRHRRRPLGHQLGAQLGAAQVV